VKKVNKINMQKTFKVNEIFEDIPEDSGNILMKIPNEICAQQGWIEGDTLTIELKNGVIIISKSPE
jgi:hypothetical protein